MGIKDLWTVLGPFSERKPLYELQGKTVAVDLAGWICQAQCIAEYQVQPRMYLRNLYFRTCYLLLQGVTPVFVLEGEAPSLKHKTIAARNAVQFKGARPKPDGAPAAATTKGRTRFHHVLAQCETMLTLMGVPCVTAAGEAEAMCAYLNDGGFIDGCISQDSDCFAYGAKVVYRNFSISQQGNATASGGSVDVYDITKAKRAMDFGRNKSIALALFCGSDYNNGVFGVGKDTVMKMFETIPDMEILDYIRTWRSVPRPVGKILTKNELNIRRKAVADSHFPDEDLVREFLNRRDSLGELNLTWREPQLKKFMDFTIKYLQWDEPYAFEKFFPILTRWTMQNPGVTDPKPEYIKKRRKPKGVNCFEIVWKYEDFENCAPEELLDAVSYASLEPEEFVRRSYPELVEEYEASKSKGKKVTNKKRKVEKVTKCAKRAPLHTIENYLRKDNLNESNFGDEDDDMDLSSVVEDITSRGMDEVQRRLNEIRKMLGAKGSLSEDLFEKTFNEKNSVLSEENTGLSEENKSSFEDEDEDLELSFLVENITNRGLVGEVVQKLNEIKATIRETSNESIIGKKETYVENQAKSEARNEQTGSSSRNRSSFFMAPANENEDLFEKTFNEMNFVHSDGTSSENEEEEIKADKESVNDSFDEVYVPLYERLKMKI